MANKMGEQLSALADGECEMPEQEWVLRRLAGDADFKARWQRYYLVSDAMKNNLPECIDVNFADRIKQAIDADSPPLQIPQTPAIGKSPTFSWYKPVTGFALAASVAAVAVLGFRLADVSDLMKEGMEPSTVASLENESGDRVLESRLNPYFVNHNEYASMNSVHGVLPYVRIVGYETQR
jgi:sigma-E factor negative regulatory protein RseA